jgi:hypothetical protein
MSDIAVAARLLMAPGEVNELRIPKAGRQGTISGYFDDAEKLAAAAAELDGGYAGIYITLNPCKRALLSRAYNRCKERAEITTADGDILRRQWLPIDFDPARPVGVSSSNYEHGRAIAVACATWDELRTMGWGDPPVADSGNGAHLLYRLDPPNTPEVTAAVQCVLASVEAHCGTEDVNIDLSVFNAARIWKLYGTLSRKGDSTSERPHRRSRILEAPTSIGVARLSLGKAAA